jgi:hypothetical protein
MITGAVSVVLANLQNDDRWLQISLQGSFQTIAGWMFQSRFLRVAGDPTWSFLGVGLVTVLAWTVLVLQVRRMEAAV